jgi:hypothetical protein
MLNYKKRTILEILIVILILLFGMVMTSAAQVFSDGSGDADDPGETYYYDGTCELDPLGKLPLVSRLNSGDDDCPGET